MPDDCAVRVVDLPPGIGGAVMVDDEGFANIYINARHGRDAQLRSLEHELLHVKRGDIYNDMTILEVEGGAYSD